MNTTPHKITAERARVLLGPNSDQLTDNEVIRLVNLIVAQYEDYIKDRKGG